MLKLVDIVKKYGKDDNVVTALKNINLEFRQSEFVSILGQSGCGKTTMLNIIGGLDRYTSGNLIIDGVETRKYSDVDWDLYRNKRVGFIFQSYNLIGHISILANVEMALTLSGVGKKERQERAIAALAEVGLSDQATKRPNQLSGGQMQRVSIARALVNNPHIILADEPTGALDSETSKQIMEILKNISSEKLIIMVTHNAELAEQYSNRIIKLNDGMVVGDSNPYVDNSKQIAIDGVVVENCVEDKEDKKKDNIDKNAIVDELNIENCDKESGDKNVDNVNKNGVKVKLSKEEKTFAKEQNKQKKKSLKKTSMSIGTALKLSFTNLMTKKGRTFMTSFAGSIGIIGVALVLAISNGFSGYIKTMQTDMLASYPISVASQDINAQEFMNIMMGGATTPTDGKNKFPTDSALFPKNPADEFKNMYIFNIFTKDYVDYVEKLKDKNWVGSIRYSYNVEMNVIGEINTAYAQFDNFSKYHKVNEKKTMADNMSGIMTGGNAPNQKVDVNWQEMAGDEAFILQNYDVIAGQFPQNKNQLAMVVDEENKVDESILASMNLPFADKSINFDKVVGNNGVGGIRFKLVMNNEYYIYNETTQWFKANDDAQTLYQSQNDKIENLDVTCVLRPKKDAKLLTLKAGVAYRNDLTGHVLDNALKSDIAKAQRASMKYNVIDGKPIDFPTRKALLELLGATELPSYINIFPTDFKAKEDIKSYLDEWNVGKPDLAKITYSDMSQVATDFMSKTVNIISIVLVCFAAVSLVVSSVMIGIITYVSVVERTKEIGILRSLGARKFDVSNVFNAETAIIGFIAGLFGVVVTYLLSIPINLIIYAKLSIKNLCFLNPWHALLMVVLSVGLTLIAGLIPARIASKKDPVVALRTE